MGVMKLGRTVAEGLLGEEGTSGILMGDDLPSSDIRRRLFVEVGIEGEER